MFVSQMRLHRVNYIFPGPGSTRHKARGKVGPAAPRGEAQFAVGFQSDGMALLFFFFPMRRGGHASINTGLLGKPSGSATAYFPW